MLAIYFLLLFSYLHTDAAIGDGLIVQVFNSILCMLGIGHLDKAKTLRTSCLFIHDEITSRHLAKLGKQIFDFRFCGAARKVSNDHFHRPISWQDKGKSMPI